MKKLRYPAYILSIILVLLISCSSDDTKKTSQLYIFATTDVHGAIFDNDPLSGEKNYSSMARLSSFLTDYERDSYILLDNGDNLQGSPAVYYYNFEDTLSEHLWSRVLNYLDYDASTVGNHDIEAGHDVYDRVRMEYDFPLLAANAVSAETGRPYFKPYTIINKNGLKVAVMGLVTPGVPGWLPPVLYEGIEFNDMVETAEKWMPVIREEKPDLVVGLFHAGWNETYAGEKGSYLNENASLAVARQVEGFDIIMMGHDHDTMNDFIINEAGDSVLVLDGSSRARYVQAAGVTYTGGKDTRIMSVKGELVNITGREPDNDFCEYFKEDYLTIKDYVSRKAGTISQTLSSRDSYFGDSGFMDLIHELQMDISGADVSFAAPLSYDVSLEKGPVRISHMFDLYRYENMLYTIEMSGEEIDRYLEYSYADWFSTMQGPDDKMFEAENTGDSYRFKNRTYNFDSAQGIEYIANLEKEDGEKINIIAFSDGRPFEMDRKYRVALNSYRGSGGGGHLAHALGTDNGAIEKRMLKSTDKDLRYYMIKWFENNGDIIIEADNNWHLVPETWASQAGSREYKKLFTTNN